MTPIVSVHWLNENLNNPDLKILDSSIAFQIPSASKPDLNNKIPGALRFDYDSVFCDPFCSLPHTMPPEHRFNYYASQLGLDKNKSIVVYDNTGTVASPRAWWMLVSMGYDNVYVLDGGLSEWKNAGYQLVTEYSQASDIVAQTNRYSALSFVDTDYVFNAIENDESLTLDARSTDRFHARVKEPREGIRSGHIPNSVCLPYADLLNGNSLKGRGELETIFHNIVPDKQTELIFTCGSGVTACILLLGAWIAGYRNLRVYDGSWTEWGQTHHLPIATGN